VLPSEFRLKHQEEIRTVLRSKLSAKTTHTLIKIQKSDLPTFRIAIIISKKVFKRANKRNRIRRKIIALFEELKYNDRLPPFVSCIIQVQNKLIITKKSDDLKTEIIPELSTLYTKMLKQKQSNTLPR
jgi:ribonuclease P protein component